MKQQATNKRVQIIKYVVLVALIALLGWKVYENYKLTKEAYVLRNQIIEQNDIDKQEQEIIDGWDTLNQNRIVNYGMTIVWFGIVFFFVARVGTKVYERKRVSKEEAENIAASIEAEYREKGMYVDKSLEDEEIIDYTSLKLDVPVLKHALYMGDYVEVAWESVPYANRYKIFRATEDYEWQGLEETQDGVTSYKDYSITQGVKYIYSVKALCDIDGNTIRGKSDPLGIVMTSGLKK